VGPESALGGHFLGQKTHSKFYRYIQSYSSHFILKMKPHAIPRTMQLIAGRTAQECNRRKKRKGKKKR
jgi:hypothetical protein